MHRVTGFNAATLGICLKPDHFHTILESKPSIGWFEIHPENYMGDGGAMHHFLRNIAELYPLSFHSIGLSLGSANWQQQDHLQRLKKLVDNYSPVMVSDHLSWSYRNPPSDQHQVDFLNDLLPLPYTQESLTTICNNIDRVHDVLQRTILIENPSNYFASTLSDISETEFLTTVAQRTGAGLLLDVNNVYVSSVNNNTDPAAYIDAIDPQFVKEIHLAGHSQELHDDTKLLIDDHSCRVCDDVWTLYRQTIAHCGAVSTLIEWDTDVPPLEVLLEEAAKAQSILDGSDGDRRIAC